MFCDGNSPGFCYSKSSNKNGSANGLRREMLKKIIDNISENNYRIHKLNWIISLPMTDSIVLNQLLCIAGKYIDTLTILIKQNWLVSYGLSAFCALFKTIRYFGWQEGV